MTGASMRHDNPVLGATAPTGWTGDSEKYRVDKMVRGFRHPTLSKAIHYFF